VVRFPIQTDEHLPTVLHHVERNPLRAALVERAAQGERAEAWQWSSLPLRAMKPTPTILAPSPTHLPAGWTALVNRPPDGRTG